MNFKDSNEIFETSERDRQSAEEVSEIKDRSILKYQVTLAEPRTVKRRHVHPWIPLIRRTQSDRGSRNRDISIQFNPEESLPSS